VPSSARCVKKQWNSPASSSPRRSLDRHPLFLQTSNLSPCFRSRHLNAQPSSLPSPRGYYRRPARRHPKAFPLPVPTRGTGALQRRVACPRRRLTRIWGRRIKCQLWPLTRTTIPCPDINNMRQHPHLQIARDQYSMSDPLRTNLSSSPDQDASHNRRNRSRLRSRSPERHESQITRLRMSHLMHTQAMCNSSSSSSTNNQSDHARRFRRPHRPHRPSKRLPREIRPWFCTVYRSRSV